MRISFASSRLAISPIGPRAGDRQRRLGEDGNGKEQAGNEQRHFRTRGHERSAYGGPTFRSGAVHCKRCTSR